MYHLDLTLACEPSTREKILGPWRDTLLGRRNMVSNDNEVAWRGTLSRICKDLYERAESHVSLLSTQGRNGEVPWFSWMQGNILSLWKEEFIVAVSVARSLENDEKF